MTSTPEDLEFLRIYLSDCAEIYLTGDLSSQRLAVVSALLGVAKYLEGQNFGPATLLPVIRPALALADRHQSSALDKMFTERPRDGRPSATTDGHLRTAILATFAEVWLRLCEGDGRKQASKLAEAARKMSGGWFGDISGSQLKTAREIVSREAPSHLVVESADRFSRLFDSVIETVGLERSFAFMVRYVNHHPVSGAMGILKTTPVSSVEEDRS